ncbi:MAG TPA: low molecular weight protein-tyrosine-phosphatase [Candidatus Methylomirabilis sp.]|nr:low molecular weight protein-tyrosine-phosphatase [Candidatus Methylomirabilis sp.]
MVRVLFVCLGNICRSPTAEGVFRKLVREEKLEHLFEIDSAGTHAYHLEEPPDERAMAACERRGIDISGRRGRKATAADIQKFDYVLAMDRENYEHLLAISAPGYEVRVRLLMEFAADRPEEEVPDPYFGGASGFDRVLDMIEAAARGLLDDIRRTRL